MDITGIVVYVDYFLSVIVKYMHKILSLLGIEWIEEESGTGIFDKIFSFL